MKKQKGFTLVEVFVVLVFIAIILVGVGVGGVAYHFIHKVW